MPCAPLHAMRSGLHTCNASSTCKQVHASTCFYLLCHSVHPSCWLPHLASQNRKHIEAKSASLYPVPCQARLSNRPEIQVAVEEAQQAACCFQPPCSVTWIRQSFTRVWFDHHIIFGKPQSAAVRCGTPRYAAVLTL